MATHREISNFQYDVVSESIPPLLERAIDWIQQNIECEDVFSEEQLADWAKANGFVPQDDLP